MHLAWGPNNHAESYRRFLSYMFHRLQQSRDAVDATAAYSSAAEFEQDHAADPRQPACQSRRTPGRTLRRFPPAQGAHVRISICTHSTSASTRACTRSVIKELGPTSSMAEPNPPRARNCSTPFAIIAELKRTYPPSRFASTSSAARNRKQDVFTVVRLAKIAECKSPARPTIPA